MRQTYKKDENFYLGLSMLFAAFFGWIFGILNAFILDEFFNYGKEIYIITEIGCALFFATLAYLARKGNESKKWAAYFLKTAYWGFTWSFAIGFPLTIQIGSPWVLIISFFAVTSWLALRYSSELKEDSENY